ncbi:hypothetical protein BN1263460001 [Stenotrophomonas indicatrix]|nr:hypothetical protein BN1263460001 [Stenotrophomonas indicatrix]
MFERSEFRAAPRRTEEHRAPARSAGSRMAACFFGYFLCTSKESDKPTYRRETTAPAKRPAPPNRP